MDKKKNQGECNLRKKKKKKRRRKKKKD